MRPSLWFSVVFLALLVLATAGGTLLVRGNGRAATLDAVPAEASLVMQSPDPSRLARAVARTPLAAASADPDQPLLFLVQGVSALFGRAGVPLPAAASGWLERSGAETALALVPQGSGDSPAVLLVARVGRHAPSEAAPLRQAILPSVSDGAVWSERRHRAHTYSVLRSGDGPPLCVAVSRGLLIVSTSGALMRRSLDTLDGRSHSLANDASARAARDRLPKRADLYLHASGDAVRAWIEREAPKRPWLPRAAHFAGVSALRHAALAVQVRQGMFHERMFLVLAPEGRGLPGAILDGSPRAEPRNVPRDPRFAARVALSLGDPSRAWSALPATLLSSQATSADLAERLSGLEAFLDIDLGRELFGSLGRDVRLSWGQAEPLPRSAPGLIWRDPWELSIALRNPEAAKRVLRRTDGLARAIGSRKEQEGGTPGVVWYELPTLAPLVPAYRLKGRVLHFASSPALLMDEAVGAGDAAGLPPGAERGLPSQAHVQFHLSTRRLADAAAGSRSGDPWTAPWRETLRGIAVGNPPLLAGAGRMDSSGLLLQWVSPVSVPLMALVALDNPENRDEDDPRRVIAGEDPLY